MMARMGLVWVQVICVCCYVCEECVCGVVLVLLWLYVGVLV